MSGIRFAVELEGRDGLLEGSYDGRDVRAWEADTGESYLSTEDTYTQREHLAWYGLRRAGATDLDLEGFRAVCVSVTVTRDEPVVAGPTQPEATAGPS